MPAAGIAAAAGVVADAVAVRYFRCCQTLQTYSAAYSAQMPAVAAADAVDAVAFANRIRTNQRTHCSSADVAAVVVAVACRQTDHRIGRHSDGPCCAEDAVPTGVDWPYNARILSRVILPFSCSVGATWLKKSASCSASETGLPLAGACEPFAAAAAVAVVVVAAADGGGALRKLLNRSSALGTAAAPFVDPFVADDDEDDGPSDRPNRSDDADATVAF